MAVTIDELQIRISGSSTNAYASVDALIDALERLQSIRLDNSIAHSIDGIGKAATKTASRVSRMTTAFADACSGINKYAMTLKNFQWQFGKRGFSDATADVVNTRAQIGMNHGETSGKEIIDAEYTEVADEVRNLNSEYSTLNDLNFRVAKHMADLNAEMADLDAQTKSVRHSLSGFGTQLIGAFKSAAKSANELFRAFTRIAKYRIMRTVIKEIASAFAEGTNNIYQYSKALNGTAMGQFANDMDSIASSLATFKNAIGAAVAPVISALVPVLNAIVQAATNAANAVARFLAIMGGKSTYVKAIAYNTEYAASAEKTAGAVANAVKEATAGIDELNVISQASSSGGGSGGGGSSSTPDFSKMYESTGVGEVSDFLSSLKLTLDDVFFEWEDITPEQLAEKLLVALMGLVGFGTGLALTGNIGGGLLFAIGGVALGLLISSLTFDHDGSLSGEEILKLVHEGIWGLCGGIAGFFLGGPAGAGIGFSLGVTAACAINEVVFDDNGSIDGTEILDLIEINSPLVRVIEILLDLTMSWGKDKGDSNSYFDDFCNWVLFGNEVSRGNITGRTNVIAYEITSRVDEFRESLNRKLTNIGNDISLKWDTIKIQTSTKWTTIKNNLISTWTQIKEKSESFFTSIKEGIANKWELVKTNTSTEWTTIKLDLSTKWTLIKENSESTFAKLKSGIANVWSNVKSDTTSKWSTIKLNLSSTWTQIRLNAEDSFGQLKKSVIDIWNGLENGIKTPINAILEFIETMVNGVIDGINAMTSALNSISLDVDEDVPVIGGLTLGFDIPEIDHKTLPRLASGGLIDENGQLFVARENGAELVGNIGGHTAVMNNDQIVSAVSMGVYDAVLSAMSQSNGKAQSIQVFLNGKQIEASTRETKQRRGATIAAGGIYNFA